MQLQEHQAQSDLAHQLQATNVTGLHVWYAHDVASTVVAVEKPTSHHNQAALVTCSQEAGAMSQKSRPCHFRLAPGVCREVKGVKSIAARVNRVAAITTKHQPVTLLADTECHNVLHHGS